MVANKYAFLQITRRRFLNEWEAFKKVISRRNIRSEERFSRNAETDLVCRLLLENKNGHVLVLVSLGDRQAPTVRRVLAVVRASCHGGLPDCCVYEAAYQLCAFLEQ